MIPQFTKDEIEMMKLIGVAILVFAQVILFTKWLAEITWHYLIVVPWRHYWTLRAKAAAHDAHQCPKPDPVIVVDSFIPATEPMPEPVGNTDGGTECWFCAHAKSAHEDDYACAYPDCSCETEQYSRPPVWHTGDPMQYRDRVVSLDGTVGYEKVIA